MKVVPHNFLSFFYLLKFETVGNRCLNSIGDLLSEALGSPVPSLNSRASLFLAYFCPHLLSRESSLRTIIGRLSLS
jgi:hypothetical protein